MSGEIPVGTEFEFKIEVDENFMVEISSGGEMATFHWTEVFPEEAIPKTGDEYTLYATFKEDAAMAECRKRREQLRQIARQTLSHISYTPQPEVTL